MSIARISVNLVVALLAGASVFAQMARSRRGREPRFEQLKSLAGAWEGTKSHGVTVKLTYEVVSNGSVVMERMQPAGEAEMITMYRWTRGACGLPIFALLGTSPPCKPKCSLPLREDYQFHFVHLSGGQNAGRAAHDRPAPLVPRQKPPHPSLDVRQSR